MNECSVCKGKGIMENIVYDEIATGQIIANKTTKLCGCQTKWYVPVTEETITRLIFENRILVLEGKVKCLENELQKL